MKNKMTVEEFRAYWKTQQAKQAQKRRKEPKSKPKKENSDAKLCKVFSEYIRLKYSDGNGICFCYTCGRPGFWKTFDCGHGIPRQHLATKFEEINNRPQCTTCNWAEGGKREKFKERMDQEHGSGTWEKLELRARSRVSLSSFEIEEMVKIYSAEVKRLKKEKGL